MSSTRDDAHTRRWRGKIRCALFPLIVAFAGALRADQGWEGQVLRLNWENDFTAGTDRHYTQGARIEYLSRDNALPGWLGSASRRVPTWGMDIGAQKFGFGVGQEIYTPANLSTAQLLPDDRPYAGWLYASASLVRRGRASLGQAAMETLRLDVGIIGPASLAEDAQEWFHNVDPKGWSHQLRAEAAFAFRYQRQHLFSWTTSDRTWGVDLIPHLNANAGTLDVSLALGGRIRAGYRIPNEFETPNASTRPRCGAYLWCGGEGRVVARNLFLDGNTFRDSHHVSTVPWVAAGRFGVTVVLKRVELTASQTFLTREFRTQTTQDSFGTATITVKF